ncbi:hypothetical protein CP532_1104 [Ophiocordyceps camponoti-leonardi (nom. inval.)]|nr:hypothetical protein CP532_1104 [Ophiocordyceps camponoti-leonardi (nom. inval.)]
MTAPILVSFAGVSLSLAACLEYLAQRSSAHGGLALSRSIQEIPRTAMMAQKYAPIVVATLYSMVWSWVDQDVRRMQPWFALSRPQGARGRDSLFLSYPQDFVVFAARKAAKKRHWAVFTSSLMMMVILFVLTPLQPSVMGVRSLIHNEPINLSPPSRNNISRAQVPDVSFEFAMHAYMIQRFHGTLPLFTTREYALTPFSVEQDDRSRRANANITAKTTKFWAEFDCWPPKLMYLNGSLVSGDGAVDRGATITIPAATIRQGQAYSFGFSDDGKCSFKVLAKLNDTKPFGLYYGSDMAQYKLWSPPHGQEAGAAGCNMSLVGLASARLFMDKTNAGNPEIAISARVCRRLYYEQDFVVTVSAATSKLYESSLRAVSERLPLNESKFSLFGFEEYIQMLNFQSGNLLDRTNSALLAAMNEPLNYPDMNMGSDMLKFLFMGTNLSTSELVDPAQMVYEVGQVRKFLFALAVHYRAFERPFNAAPSENRAPNDVANVTFPLSGIIVSRLFSALVEALLLLNAAGALILLRLCQRFPCRLKSNPSSISRICRLGPYSEVLVRNFQKLDFADEKTLKSVLADRVFRLSSGRLPRPTDNFELLQILEKYIPSFFATLLEAFWVLINRQFCLLEPFRQLCAGKARPDRTIETTYSAIPPQLTVWRAIKARHFVLAMLCLTTLLANLLGISLGTLFSENIAVIRYTQRFEPMVAPSFNNESLLNFHQANKGIVPRNDTFLLYAEKTSTNTPLPRWTSKDYFFLPHQFDRSAETAKYTVITRGLGAQANCIPLHRLSPPQGEQNPECPSALSLAAQEWDNGPKSSASSSSTSEPSHCSRELAIPSRLNDTGACEFDFVLAWARAMTSCPGYAVARDTNSSRYSPEATALHCRPLLRTALFNVTVDETGNVDSYSRINDDELVFDYPDFTVHRRLLLRYAMDFDQNTDWHPMPHARNWISLLISASRGGSRDFLNATNPPPNATELLPTVEEIYRQGFAIFLGQHPDLFNAARAGESVDGARLATETRIFLDRTSLIISLAVMVVNMVVAVVIYARPAVRVLPRMPTSIASIIAYVAPSRIVADANETLRGETLSYGQYIGVDGKPHTGIELDPHVTPVKPDARDSVAKELLDNLSGDQRNSKQSDNSGERYEQGQPNSHQLNDPKDQRSISNRLAAEERKGEPADDKETAMSKKDPTLPAKAHGNEPSKGAKIDAEIQAEEEEMLKRKGKA